MDPRLIVTTSYAGTLLAGTLLALSYSMTDVTFTEGQREFLLFVSILGGLIALVLVWAKNYVLGPPLYIGVMGGTAWFTGYFFFVHDNPGTVWAASGAGAPAYTISALAVVIASLTAAGVGCWLWYRESPGFRSVVDNILKAKQTGD